MLSYFHSVNWNVISIVIALTLYILPGNGAFAKEPSLSPDELRANINSTADFKEKYISSYQLLRFFFFSNADSTIHYAEKMVEFATEIEKDSLLSTSYFSLGNALLNYHLFQEVLTRFLPLLKENYADEVKIAFHFTIHKAYIGLGLLEKGRVHLEHAQVLMGENKYLHLSVSYVLITGDYYLNSGEYLKALYAYNEALRLLDEGFMGNRSTVLQSLIVVYQAIGIHERAIEMTQQELESTLSNEDDYGAIYAYFLHGESQYHLGDLTGAINSAREAIQVSQRSGYTSSIGFAYYQVGRIYLESGELDSARWYAEMGVKISEENGDRKERGECLSLLSELHVRAGEYPESLKIAREVLSMNLYLGLNCIVYESMAEASAGLGRFDDAYLYLKKIQTINDSLDVVEPAIQISSELIQKDFEQKEFLSQLEYEEEVTKWQNGLFVISGALLLLFITIFSVYKNNVTSNQNKYLDQLNRSLKSRNDAIRRFTFMTSHDLLEPVRVIGSMTGLLKRRLNEGTTDRNLEKLSFIQNSVDTLGVMTAGVREYAEVLNPEQNWDHFDFQKLAEDLYSWCKSENIDRHGTLSIHADSEIQMLHYPYSQLKSILEHLIANSFQANLNSDLLRVDVSVGRENEFIVFKVADNGVGINKEYQEQIFEPFKTLENKLISKRSGLGLSICKLMVENNGGQIWIDSTTESGVVVLFSLPLQKPDIL